MSERQPMELLRRPAMLVGGPQGGHASQAPRAMHCTVADALVTTERRWRRDGAGPTIDCAVDTCF